MRHIVLVVCPTTLRLPKTTRLPMMPVVVLLTKSLSAHRISLMIVKEHGEEEGTNPSQLSLTLPAPLISTQLYHAHPIDFLKCDILQGRFARALVYRVVHPMRSRNFNVGQLLRCTTRNVNAITDRNRQLLTSKHRGWELLSYYYFQTRNTSKTTAYFNAPPTLV